MNLKLSICIPTFNRATELRETLMAFIPQLTPYGIEICISDNSSNTDTEEMVNSLLPIYPHIRYRRNSENIGIDRNIYAATAMTSTDYFWIFGDDDWPQEGAVQRVYEQLERNPAIVVVNSYPVTKDMLPMEMVNMTGICQDRIYTDAEKFLVELSWYCTFIGGLIIKRQDWLKIKPDRYYDTVFVHVGIIFEMLKKVEVLVHFISAPLIAYRTNNATWSSQHMKVQLELWPKTIGLLPDSYSEDAKEAAVLGVSCRFMGPGIFFKAKLNGQFDIATYNKYIFTFWRARKNRWGCAGKLLGIATICLLMPKPLIKMMYKLRQK